MRRRRTDGPILTICKPYDVFLRKDVLFEIWLTSRHWRVNTSKVPKDGVNRHFQAKLAKYEKFDIIKTTYRFHPNFTQR